MPEFNPDQDYGDQQGSSKFDNNLPPNDYNLVGVYLIARTSQKGNDYARVKLEVIDGPMKGASFWQMLGMDFSNELAMAKLGWWCQSSRLDYSFSTDDMDQLAGALLFRPFAANVKRTTYQGKPQNAIGRFLLPSRNEISNEAIEVMTRWQMDNEDPVIRYRDDRGETQGGGYNDAPPPNDDDYNGRSGGGYSSGDSSGDQTQGGQGGYDDDSSIPF